MSASRLTQWVSGFLLLELRGDGTAEVLVDLQQAGIPLHHVRVWGARCTLGINLSDFRVCLRICRRHRVKIRFIEKEGLPFLSRKWMRRKSMLVGAGVFFALLYIMGSMVWQVSVSGVDEEEQTAVLQAAHECGLYRGAWKNSLDDVTILQGKMLDKLPGFIWIGVQLEGGKVTLEGLPKVPNVTPGQEAPRNVVAAKPGVIRGVYATRGQSMVKAGQVVHPGQVLISGILGEGAKQVPADGEVMAEVWYTSKVEVPLKVTQSALTGNTASRDYLVVGPWAIRVWGWEQPDYKGTFEQSEDEELNVGGLRMPVHLRRVTLYEATAGAVQQSRQQAEQTALRLVSQDVQRQMGEDGVILTQKVLQFEVSHGKLYETVLTRTEENIGVAAAISGNG